MTKTLALSRKCTHRAKIFAGVIPLTPVDSGVAPTENLPPLVCLTGKYSLFFFFFFPMAKHSFFLPPKFVNSQHLNYNFQPAQAVSEVYSVFSYSRSDGELWAVAGKEFLNA